VRAIYFLVKKKIQLHLFSDKTAEIIRTAYADFLLMEVSCPEERSSKNSILKMLDSQPGDGLRNPIPSNDEAKVSNAFLLPRISQDKKNVSLSVFQVRNKYAGKKRNDMLNERFAMKENGYVKTEIITFCVEKTLFVENDVGWPSVFHYGRHKIILRTGDGFELRTYEGGDWKLDLRQICYHNCSKCN